MSKANNNRKSNKCNNKFNQQRNKNYAKDRQTNYPNTDESYSNDWKWYAGDEAIARGAASINWSWSTGTKIDGLMDGYAVPGIAVMKLMPCVGYSDTPSSPVNVAANTVYSFVRHANSGHSNYDAPDLMIYLIAMSQVYSYINHLQRLYGIAQVYSQKNRYLPDMVLKALGADPNSIRTDQAKFRYGINMLVNKAASFAIPSNMPFFNRQAFLYTGLYTEGNSIKDQMYAFMPKAFYKFNDNQGDPQLGGSLDITEFDNGVSSRTVDQLIAFGNDLIDVLIKDEDMNIMSGDILKAYGQDGIIKLMSVPETYTVVPTFDITVLEQFKNARIVNLLDKSDVTQSSTNLSPYLMSCPVARRTSMFESTPYLDTELFGYKYVLTTSVAEPGPEVTIENTRLAPAFVNQVWTPDKKTVDVGVHGCSEIPVELVIYGYKYTNAGRQGMSVTMTDFYKYVLGKNSEGPNIEYEGMGSVFHFLPTYYVVTGYIGPDAKRYGDKNYLMAELENYAIIDNDVLKQMHEAALLNMLHVDTIAKIKG